MDESKQLITRDEDIPLKPEQNAFINCLLLSNNRKMAAQKTGISISTAKNWLKEPNVKREIQNRIQSAKQRCDITLDECLNELGKIAFFDFKDIATDFKHKLQDGELGLTFEEFEDMDTSVIQEMTVKLNAQGIPYIVVKPYNKVEALKELLNRLSGGGGEKHLHLHLSKEDMKGKTAQELAANYQRLVQKSFN